jgi:ABC-type uncharacterized transport system permease subunit
MGDTLFFILFLFYFSGFVFYLLSFETREENYNRWAEQFASSGLFLHFIFLLALLAPSRGFALTHLSESIQTTSFLILVAAFTAESKFKAKSLMLFSLPMALLFSLLAVLLSHEKPVPESLPQSPWLFLHTGLILAGFVGFAIAVSTAVMYLLQSAQLKSKHLGNVFLKLPSLSTLDRLHFASLSGGVILFSFGILSGVWWAKNLRELDQIFKDPKVILSLFTCAMYWLILSLRLSALRRGQKIAAGTVLMFLLVFMTLLSSAAAPSGFHKGF